MIRRSWLRLLCVLLLAALVGAACGSDREDDPAAPEGTETTEPAEESEGVAIGDFELPCGEGDGGENAAGDPGVTADSITIGYGDDAGFSGSPGLNRHMSHAVKALVDACNEQGGINGRTIEAKYYDAKITDVNNAMQQACTDGVFMLVGQGWSFDSGQEETRLGCELPSVPTYSVSPAFANGPLMIQGVPNPVDFTPAAVADQMVKLFPEESKKVATLVANYAATLDTRNKIKSAYPEFGMEFLDCDVEYNIAGESDWKPFVQRLKDCGAEMVYFAGSPMPNFANFLEAASQLDFKPVFLVDANFYEKTFAEWNTSGLGDNVYLRFAFVPFEERDEVKAVDDYLTIVEESGGDVSLLGMQATSSTLLWMQGVAACGADLSRACVIEEIGKITDWTAGGLHAPTQPGENLPPACGTVLKLTGTAYERVAPEAVGEFDCDDRYVAEVSGAVVDQAKLDENRVSTLFQK